MEGIDKIVLEAKRDDLMLTVAGLEADEQAAADQSHQAISDKQRLKVQLIEARNRLDYLEGLIVECVVIESMVMGRP